MKDINWKYAIGEILIVITGISIAFSLNNWKESNAEKHLRDKYLESIKLDLQKDIASFKKNIESLDRNIENIKIISPYLGTGLQANDSIVTKFYSLAWSINFRPHNITYNSMINSGDFKLITNFDLKSSIEEHYSGYENINQDYVRQQKISEKYLADFFIHDLDYDVIRKGDYSFLNIKVLKNIVQSMNGTFYIKIRASKNGIESAEKLIELIDKELAK